MGEGRRKGGGVKEKEKTGGKQGKHQLREKNA